MNINDASKGIGTGLGIAAMGVGLGIAFDAMRGVSKKCKSKKMYEMPKFKPIKYKRKW